MSMSEDSRSPSPSAQLFTTIEEAKHRIDCTRRPILTHLNADTSWLISIPYPASSPPSRLSKWYYHILIDPWFRGPQVDIASFFSQQSHAERSFVQTISEVEDVIREIEAGALRAWTRYELARAVDDDDDVMLLDTSSAEEKDSISEAATGGGEVPSPIDIVVIAHEFTGHMHKATLLEVPPNVPVLATATACAAITEWKHFSSVSVIPHFISDWRTSSFAPLPDWIGVSRVTYDSSDLLHYHSAIMICFPYTSTLYSPTSASRDGDMGDRLVEKWGEAESILYTPHGIRPENLVALTSPSLYPKIHTLALLHGLHFISLNARPFTFSPTVTIAPLNFGAHNGLQVQQLLKAKYWIATHDEVKTGGGMVSWLLRREKITIGEALALEGIRLGGVDEFRFETLGNGERLVLE